MASSSHLLPCCSLQSSKSSRCLRKAFLDPASTSLRPLPPPFLVPKLETCVHNNSGLRYLTTTFHRSKHADKHSDKQFKKWIVNEARMESSSHTEDPEDFSDYELAIQKTHEHLRSELARLKAGGREPDSIENLLVNLGKKGGGKGERGTRVGDLASVMQRGRNVVVMVGEKEHLKAITSALNSIPDMTPQPPPPGGDPLHIILPIPPVTMESRTAASKVAAERGEAAAFALREARGAQKKRLRGLVLSKKVTPDRNRRAEGKMEKINEKATKEVKKIVEEARKRLEGGGGGKV